jgi:hypothetical protein
MARMLYTCVVVYMYIWTHVYLYILGKKGQTAAYHCTCMSVQLLTCTPPGLGQKLPGCCKIVYFCPYVHILIINICPNVCLYICVYVHMQTFLLSHSYPYLFYVHLFICKHIGCGHVNTLYLYTVHLYTCRDLYMCTNVHIGTPVQRTPELIYTCTPS